MVSEKRVRQPNQPATTKRTLPTADLALFPRHGIVPACLVRSVYANLGSFVKLVDLEFERAFAEHRKKCAATAGGTACTEGTSTRVGGGWGLGGRLRKRSLRTW